MVEKLIKWDIYEISSMQNLEGIMLRGRIRKFALLNSINLLTENAIDKQNKVRFAIISNQDPIKIINKIKQMIPNSEVEIIDKGIVNPVLSKLKVNQEERYSL
jgi:hypothetical protein